MDCITATVSVLTLRTEFVRTPNRDPMGQNRNIKLFILATEIILFIRDP
jgi:hypothetical protein